MSATRKYRLVQANHFVRNEQGDLVEAKVGTVLDLTEKQAANLKNKVVPYVPGQGAAEKAQTDALLAEARAEADRIVAAAKAEAADVVNGAKQEADAIVTTAIQAAQDAK